MGHYLVVAHQTATSPDLLRALRGVTREDRAARFTLLVPATPVDHLLTWTEGETLEVAKRTADEAAEWLRESGMEVEEALVGDSSPVDAVDDLLSNGSARYDGIVLSTFKPGLSRWLRLDAVHRIARKQRLPVTHVVCERGQTAVATAEAGPGLPR